MIEENPTNGVLISTEDIRENGHRWYYILNTPGILNVIPSLSILILLGNTLFPSDIRDA